MYEKITNAIQKHAEKHRLVFWYDEDGKHRDAFTAIEIDGEKLEIDNNEWAIKYRVLTENPEGRFLIYAPYARPADEDNWLLDLNLTDFVFSSDLGETYREELGLPVSFRQFVQTHRSFFGNRDRFELLRQLIDPATETEDVLARKMMSVSTAQTAEERQVSRNFASILRSLALETIDDRDDRWKTIGRFGLFPYFRRELESYIPEPANDITPAGAVIEIFKTAFEYEQGAERTPQRRNCRTIVHEWRDIRDHDGMFKRIVRYVQTALDVETQIANLAVSDLLNLYLFPAVDSILAHRLLDMFEAPHAQHDEIRKVADARSTSYWVRDRDSDLSDVYRFIVYAIDLIGAIDRVDLAPGSALDLWNRYAEELYRIDTLYRQALASYEASGKHGVMRPIVNRLEGRYTNDFLQRLCEIWDPVASTKGLDRQRKFFDSVVAPYLHRGDKLIVIVSDALRYEVGAELSRRLQAENRIQAGVTPMAATVPTETRFGMNALLPHRTIAIEGDTVKLDGKNVIGIPGRSDYLSATVSERFPGTRAAAYWITDIVDLPRDAARAMIQDYDLVYLYTNGIDSVGDTAKIEQSLPVAVEREIQTILLMIRKIGNQLNRTHILVTADHGFLFQNQEPPDVQMLAAESPPGAQKERRYIAGDAFSPGEHFRTFTCEELGLDGSVVFHFVTGLYRIRKQGAGTRYVHGGLSLQELMIPVVRVHIGRSDDVAYVPVEIMRAGKNVITTPTYKVSFFQVEPVSTTYRPMTIRACFVGRDDTVLSDTAEITFDSADPNAENRGTGVEFTFGTDAVHYNGSTIVLKLEKIVGGAAVPYRSVEYRYQTMGERDF